MRPWIYSVPMVVFFLTAIFTGAARLNLMDPRIVKRPGGLWGPFRVIDDDEWTVEGLLIRKRFGRSILLSLAAAIVAWVIVLAIAGP